MRLLEELLVPGLFTVFGAAYLATTTALPVESTVFPRTLFAVMLVLAIALVIKEATVPAPRETGRGLAALRLPALIFAASVAYLALFSVAGFVAASFVYLAGVMALLQVRAWKAVSIAAALTLSMYLIFGKLFLVGL